MRYVVDMASEYTVTDYTTLYTLHNTANPNRSMCAANITPYADGYRNDDEILSLCTSMQLR